MGLQVALGGRSLSSQCLAHHTPSETHLRNDVLDNTTHNTEDDDLKPVELYQTVAHGVCPQNEWSVRVVVMYYDLLSSSTGSRETTMARIAIQITPLAFPLHRHWDSTVQYRETVHELKLPDGAQDSYPQPEPSLLISHDRRNLAVLIFHPHQQSSALIIFQLRKPKSDPIYAANSSNNGNNNESGTKKPKQSTSSASIPIPYYLTREVDTVFAPPETVSKLRKNRNIRSNSVDDISAFTVDEAEPTTCSPVVATHPKFVSLWGVTAMANIPKLYPSCLIVACHDGLLAWLDYGSALILGKSETRLHATNSEICNDNDNVIREISATSDAPTLKGGKVFVLRCDGQATVVDWTIPPPPSPSSSRASGGKKTSFKKMTAVATSVPTVVPPRRASTGTTETTTTVTTLPTTPELKTGTAKNPVVPTNMSTSDPNQPTVQVPRQKFALSRRKSESSYVGSLSIPVKIISSFPSKSPIVTAKWITSTILAVVYRPGSVFSTSRGTNAPCMAHVFGLNCGVRNNDNKDSLRSLVRLELTQDWIDDLDSRVHKDTGGINSSTAFGLSYDAATGCLAIASMYYSNEYEEPALRKIGCVWNWRANVIGLTFRGNLFEQCETVWSKLWFANDARRGSAIVRFEQSKDETVQQHVYPTGQMSPAPSCRPFAIREATSLVLTKNSIHIPVCSKPTSSDTLEIEWQESPIPSQYRSLYGQPYMAAIGRQFGRSVAIAGTRGLCVLQQQQQVQQYQPTTMIATYNNSNKWRLFGSEAEERAFSVISFAWWEHYNIGGYSSANGKGDDDLLVAIIELCNDSSRYVACWSPKSLDLSHQLIESASSATRQAISWGIRLPPTFHADSLSLISDPANANDRRAVILVSSVNQDTGTIEYQTISLQVVHNNSPTVVGSYAELRPLSVLAKQSSAGVITKRSNVITEISIVSLFSASFDFDLTIEWQQSPNEGFVGTLAVARTPGGMEAITLSTKGVSNSAPITSEVSEVSKYWLADIICANDADKSLEMDAFVWVIESVSGRILSWSVPFITFGQEYKRRQSQIPSSGLGNGKQPKHQSGLSPPIHIFINSKHQENTHGLMLGTVCHLGSASDWMQHSSPGSQTSFSLGHVPGSSFGCILSAGQGSRKFHRILSANNFNIEFFKPDFLDHEVFGLGDFSMTPPAFVPALYSLFLESAYIRGEMTGVEGKDKDNYLETRREQSTRLAAIESHTQHRLQSNPNKDAVMMALRLLIMRSVEWLAAAQKKHLKEKDNADIKARLRLAKLMFSEIVDAVRRCTTGLQFASLFLEVGRQIEPSCLVYLFPLPQASPQIQSSSSSIGSVDGNSWRKNEAKTVDDLLGITIAERSLPAAASALPLLNSKQKARRYCEQLLDLSLEAIANNLTSRATILFDTTEEERKVLGDIYRFGSKLEEATDDSLAPSESDVVYDDEDDDDGHISLGSSDSGSGSGNGADIRHMPSQLFCSNSSGRRGSLFNYIAPALFSSNSDVSREEKAISKAAVSFIQTGFDSDDDTDNSFVITAATSLSDSEHAVSNIIEIEHDSGLEMVAGVVARFVEEQVNYAGELCWSAISAVSWVLQEDSQNNSDDDFDFFNSLVAMVEILDFANLLGQNGFNRVDLLLEAKIIDCNNEKLTPKEASNILDFIVMIMCDLHKHSTDLQQARPELILVALVTAHISGRIEEILSEIGENCAAYDWYSRANSRFLAKERSHVSDQRLLTTI